MLGDILENATNLLPFMLIPWVLFFISVYFRPQHFRNCIFLMISAFFTMFYLAGLFGSYMGYALIVLLGLVFLALLAVPVILIINGIEMIRKEGKSISHLLSFFLGLLVGAGEIGTFILLFTSVFRNEWFEINNFLFWFDGSVFYFSSLILAFVVYAFIVQILPHRNNFQYIVIHGCGLIGGNRVSKLLANRLDRAIKIYNHSKNKPILIPSGGKGSDESISEAEAMTEYLLQHGIPAENIIQENKSTTTYENLQFSKQIIDAREGRKKTALVSSNYHVYRCLVYASKQKFKCTGIGGRVAAYYFPCAIIREFVAVFKTKKFLIWTLVGYVFFIIIPSLTLFFQ